MNLLNLITHLNKQNGQLEPYTNKTVRKLSDMKNFYYNRNAVEEILAKEDPIIYEVYAVEVSTEEGNLSFATTVLYPGKVGDEYYMTKGHYHSKRNRAEVYLCISGNGRMVLQDENGNVIVTKFDPDDIVYVPPYYAHRTVNVGNKPLIFLAIYPSDAGHDYGTIEEKGFRKIIIEKNGKPAVIDNPRFCK
ncbi:MAG: glucose-6-phosphate isomerase [Candidatus Asgardarchaeia archaeon]|nr:cupin domain-containing protein [Candidatus Odinarchaeota archaeon]